MRFKETVLFCLCIFLLSGCATTAVLNPHYKTGYFDVELTEQKTILVMPVDIKGYKVTAGGVLEEMDEWGQEMKDNFETNLRGRTAADDKYRFVLLEEDRLSDEEKEILENQQALYKALVSCMANPIPTKKKDFVYTFGRPFDFLDEKYDADMLMFISGASVQQTFGKIMMNILAGAVTGYMPTSEGCAAYFSLVDDETSEVIWFHQGQYSGGGTFRSEKGAKRIIDSLAKKMPFSEKK